MYVVGDFFSCISLYVGVMYDMCEKIEILFHTYVSNNDNTQQAIIKTLNKKMSTEYERLGGHLPLDVQALVREYAGPIYRNPIHFKCIQSLFGILKEHAISWVVFNELVMFDVFNGRRRTRDVRRFDAYFEKQIKETLQNKQVGQICEDEEMHMTISSFSDYLIEREILVTQPN